MIRPPLEVADVIRSHGSAFVERHRRWLTVLHHKVLRALAACRTAALGGHIEQCDSCGQRAISYNSCLNRHCPKCQAAARQRWLEKRSAELLPVPYYHVVFTLPHVLAPLALQNKALVYGLLFRATAETLLQIAADPKHLGAEIGFLAVLHTWGQTLLAHPHLHCVVPGGGLSPDHQRWIPCGPKFFLPVEVLSVVFRGKFLEDLEQAFNQHKLTLAGQLAPLQSPSAFAALLRTAAQPNWVVYAKPPFAGPAQVLTYLSRYTHRVAIANSRLVSMTEDKVSFLWRDYAHGHRTRTMTLDAHEFLRRFLLHVLPAGFVRIRYFGLLANRHRNPLLHLCREYLQASLPQQASNASSNTGVAKLCQHCHHGVMRLVEVLSPARLAVCWLVSQPENSSLQELQPETHICGFRQLRQLR